MKIEVKIGSNTTSKFLKHLRKFEKKHKHVKIKVFWAVALILPFLLGCTVPGKQDPVTKINPPAGYTFLCVPEGTAVPRFTTFLTASGQPFKWNKSALTYSFDKKLPDIMRAAFVESSRVWRAACGGNLSFTEVSSGADISVSLMPATIDPYLGYTNFSIDQGIYIKAATIQINNSVYKWHRGTPFGVGPIVPKQKTRDSDIDGVMLHELGHALGLNHAQSISSTMFSVIYPGAETLEPDDIKGLRSIYGDGAK